MKMVAAWVMVLLLFATSAQGAGNGAALREAAEYVLKKFGREGTDETVGTLTAKLTKLSAQHGEEAVAAVQKVGPRAFRLIDNGGENAPQVIGLMNRFGNDAVWVASRPKSMAIFVRHGDDAAGAMIRHREIAEPVIERFGEPAVRALNAIDGRNGRRLAMLADDGSLAAGGRADDLLSVIGRHGNRAMDFIWRNKGGILVAASLSAFVHDPEPFIDGTRDLATAAASPAQAAAQEAARSVSWTLVLMTSLAVLAVMLSLKWLVGRGLLSRRRPVPANHVP